MYYDLRVESSGWLFKSPLAGGEGHIVETALQTAQLVMRVLCAVCGFMFKSNRAANGTFTSPNYPGLYPRDTECHYLFYGTKGEKIHIAFRYFDVEGMEP